ncbi:hypothetical protein M0804_014103 [Polistes exclamans]|nr:hypothetical protein M0804_014103 [Polistes exclamans]
MTVRRGLTGAFIWSIRGKDAAVKADRVAKALKRTIPEANFSRPLWTGTIKLVGIDLGLNATIAALNKGRISFSWCFARVVGLRLRPLQCHRCLARGHVAAGCSSAVDSSGLCYRFGRPDHVASNYVRMIECMVCKDGGRKTVNHRAGSWECPVVPPRKTGAGVFLSVSECSAGVLVSASVRGDGPTKGSSSGSAERREKDPTMEVDQVDLSIPTRRNGTVSEDRQQQSGTGTGTTSCSNGGR